MTEMFYNSEDNAPYPSAIYWHFPVMQMGWPINVVPYEFSFEEGSK